MYAEINVYRFGPWNQIRIVAIRDWHPLATMSLD